MLPINRRLESETSRSARLDTIPPSRKIHRTATDAIIFFFNCDFVVRLFEKIINSIFLQKSFKATKDFNLGLKNSEATRLESN